MHETGCSGLVHWDDPEEWGAEGVGKELQDGGHMYTHGPVSCLISTCKPLKQCCQPLDQCLLSCAINGRMER